jgi:hypothetical protein
MIHGKRLSNMFNVILLIPGFKLGLRPPFAFINLVLTAPASASFGVTSFCYFQAVFLSVFV